MAKKPDQVYSSKTCLHNALLWNLKDYRVENPRRINPSSTFYPQLQLEYLLQPKKVTGTRSETLSFSKRAPAFDPSSSRFWPLKTRIFGCTFLTHHLSELYNLCSRGVKSLPRKIFHTFLRTQENINRKNFSALKQYYSIHPCWQMLCLKKGAFLQCIVVV